MAEIVSRKEKIKSKKAKFKQFLKKNMTRTWAKRVSYQIFAFLVSVAMIVGVAVYAFNKTYNEKEISFYGRLYDYRSHGCVRHTG